MRAHLASLVEDFRKHAAETAVVAHRGVRRYATTYGELAELAGRFAAELERRGIRPGERVVLWGADSAEWIGVFFGCLLRGVMVVPLDAAGDARFAGRVVEDVGARLVVGDGELLAGLTLYGIRSTLSVEGESSDRLGTENGQRTTENVERMELRGIGERLSGEPLWAVSETVGLDTPFQIVFTSGTTREPRGVVHTHRNVLATLEPIEREMAKYRRIERVFHPLRFLHSLPLSHVFGQFMGLWCPALLAAEVHFAEQLEPVRVVELIKRERISVLVAVPRVLELLRGHLLGRFGESSQLSVVSSQEGQEQCGGLSTSPAAPVEMTPPKNGGGGVWAVVRKWWRWRRVHRALGWKFWAVISGGATLPRELEAFWNGLGFALIQGYGMTETTALVTLNHPFHIKEGTIGKTLPGREVKIGDDGEILVRGDVVAGSVWEHGSMRQREGEWLATGDLAETGEGGELKFVGRKSDVIVTGAGMNVYPADLEAAVGAQAGVRGCVVVGCSFAAGPEAVAVVLFSGSEADLAAAVAEANRGLAEYQQIRRWARWPELTFPYTSTGKLVRRRVAEWVCGSSSQLSVVRSQTKQGDALLGVIREVTGEPTSQNRDVGHPARSGRDDGVLGVVAEVVGEPTSQNRDVGHPAMNGAGGDLLRLAEDLKVDSLGRVQLQSALEQRFDVELDEDAVAAVETVGELRRMVEGQLGVVSSQLSVAEGKGNPPFHGEAVKGWVAPFAGRAVSGQRSAIGEEMVYPRWAWWWWVRWVRVVWIEAVMRPLVWLLAKPKVECVTDEGTNAGRASFYVTATGTNTVFPGSAMKLPNLGHPVLVVCNHVTALDGALVLYALPGRLRRRMACAMSGEMLMDYRRGRGQRNWALNVLAPGAYWLLTALFNVFPLPRARGFRRSFAHAGEAMDRGYSVLIFPEGSRSRDGTMHGFRPGIGLLVKEAGAAVLPVGLRGLYDDTGRWFHAGKVEVRVGAMVAADEGCDAAEMTARLERAVRELVESGEKVRGQANANLKTKSE